MERITLTHPPDKWFNKEAAHCFSNSKELEHPSETEELYYTLSHRWVLKTYHHTADASIHYDLIQRSDAAIWLIENECLHNIDGLPVHVRTGVITALEESEI